MSFAFGIIFKSSIILLCAAALSPALRRSSASVRHAVWILAMAAAVLVAVVPAFVPQFEGFLLPGANASVTFLPAERLSAAAVTDPQAGSNLGRADIAELFGVEPWLIWILGVVFLLLRFVIGTVAVRRMAPTNVAGTEEDWSRLIAELASALAIKRPVRLVFSAALVSPMTWGVFRHTILLPVAAADWSEERRRLVLAHELAHVKRNDGLLQIFVQLVCSIYWFNPLVWYAAHRVRIERERACDDHVLILGVGAADYAEHLIQIVRGLRRPHPFSFAAISMAQPTQLETRLVSILDSRVRRRKLSKAGAFLSLAVTSLLAVFIGAIGVMAGVPMPPTFVTTFSPEAKLETTPPATPQRTRIGQTNSTPNTAVTPPRVLESEPPTYTPEAVFARVEGTVTLEGHVDVQGKVSGLRLIKTLGFGLDKKAMDAVQAWKFSPAVRNGKPVAAITQIEVDFRIPPPTPATPVAGAAPQDDGPGVRPGPGVNPPTVIFRVEPQYTPEAREAKYQGTVVVRGTVHQDGTLSIDEVVRGLELGLTEKAIEALQLWKFKPGSKDGKDIAVSLNIEVNFNLR